MRQHVGSLPYLLVEAPDGSILLDLPAVVCYPQNEIHLCVILLGARSHEVLDRIFEQAELSKAQREKLALENELSYRYLPVNLGDLKSFQVSCHLLSFGDDIQLRATIRNYLPRANGILVAGGEACALGDLARSVASEISRPIPTFVCAGWRAASEWRTITGQEALRGVSSHMSTHLEAVRTLTKVMLSNLP